MRHQNSSSHLLRVVTYLAVQATLLIGALGLGSFARGQSQVELNRQMADELRVVEQRLAATIEVIRNRNAADIKFLRCLEESQTAWGAYRDKQLSLIFPHEDEPHAYGSAFPMCWAIWKTRLTNQRITELRAWLDGITEGDVCTGSIPVK